MDFVSVVLGAVVPLFPGVDSEIDKGITLAIALAQRSEVFLYLKVNIIYIQKIASLYSICFRMAKMP